MMRVEQVFGAVLWFSAAATPAIAADAVPDVRYLDAMPDVARVLKDHDDPDPLKAVAMQHAAMVALKDAITNRTWEKGRKWQGDTKVPVHGFRPRTPAEEAKFEAYRQGEVKAKAQFDACWKSASCDKERAKSFLNGQQQAKFRKETMERYFKGPWLDEHIRIHKARAAERAERRNR